MEENRQKELAEQFKDYPAKKVYWIILKYFLKTYLTLSFWKNSIKNPGGIIFLALFAASLFSFNWGSIFLLFLLMLIVPLAVASEIEMHKSLNKKLNEKDNKNNTP